jgi:hypothetical protein
LLDYFAGRREAISNVALGSTVNAVSDGAAGSEIGSTVHATRLGALLRLNFLRAAVTLAAILSLVGAAIVAGFASPSSSPRPWMAFFLFPPLAGLVCCVWSALNWLLSLAAIFAVRDREDAAGGVFAAVAFFRDHPGPVLAVSTWIGLAHLVAWVGASSAISMPLGFAPILPWRLLVAAMILLTLAYFVLADWLYMARLAGYICIAEMPEALLAMPEPPLPPVAPTSPLNTIDRDEPILSDLPNLALET